ncbi:MAG: hypothetical protein FWG78_01345 [Coriobacteriia bacterium]|nr:hypothetical protein [Coriobacteriia bacterium]
MEGIKRKKWAVAAYVAGTFIVSFTRLSYALINPDSNILAAATDASFFAVGLFVLFVFGTLLFPVGLYLWMRPITLGKFFKELALGLMLALGAVFLFGIVLGALAIFVFWDTEVAGMHVIEIIATLGAIVSAAYIVCIVARMAALGSVAARISWRTFLAVLAMLVGGDILQAILDFLPKNVLFVIINATLTTTFATFTFVVAVMLCRKYDGSRNGQMNAPESIVEAKIT